MLLLLATTAAIAGSTAGMGISPLGGALSGVNEPGALGLSTNPAAAHAESAEIAADFGMSFWAIQATLDGKDPANGNGAVPSPYLAGALPLGPFGLGFSGMIPYAGGGAFPADGGQRFHLVEAEVYLMEADLALAWQPFEVLTVGAAGRLGRARVNKFQALDSSGMIIGIVGADAGVPLGDPFLEGTQTMDLSGIGFGYALGATVDLESGLRFTAAYRSPVYVPIEGPLIIVPSHDLDLELSGTGHAEMGFPREVAVGAVIPTGPVELLLEAGWTGWSTLYQLQGTLDDKQLQSGDQLTQLFVDEALTESAFLNEAQEFTQTLGNHDVFHGGAAVHIPLHARWAVRPGVWYAPTTIPDETFHTGVIDLPAWNLRGVVAWTPKRFLTTALSFDGYVIPDRTVSNSDLSLTNEPESGLVLPSANGHYAMRAARVGLTVIARR